MTKLSKDQKSFRNFTYMSDYFPEITPEQCDRLWKWIDAYTTVKVIMAKAPTPQPTKREHTGDVAWCNCECHTKGSEWSSKHTCKKCYTQSSLQPKKVKKIELPKLPEKLSTEPEYLNGLLVAYPPSPRTQDINKLIDWATAVNRLLNAK